MILHLNKSVFRKGELHRLQSSLERPYVQAFLPPFSSFDYIRQHFPKVGISLQRCFSLARSFNCQSVVYEKIPPVGMIAEENDYLREISAVSDEYVHRVSFWRKRIWWAWMLRFCRDKDLIGYAIVKHDSGIVSGEYVDSWYVFESVFVKYEHEHNCVSNQGLFSLKVGVKVFHIKGVLYCQQNNITTKCAHVAVRSLLSRFSSDGDLSYTQIHNLARESMAKQGLCYYPNKGLSARTIIDVIHGLGYECNAKDYELLEKKDLLRIADRVYDPYQSYLYAGVESGAGALLGFRCYNSSGKAVGKHIIPICGHTFNKDTWVSDADSSYLMVTRSFGYMRSENWTSSFIGHDDNFGPNYCIPRGYMKPTDVTFVLSVQFPNERLQARIAEPAALAIMMAIIAHNTDNLFDNEWVKRLWDAIPLRKCVLRTIYVSAKDYCEYVGAAQDWKGNKEGKSVRDIISGKVGDVDLLVVEFSIAQLFPANERKVGEVVFGASRPLTRNPNYPYGFEFLLVRLPKVLVCPEVGRPPRSRLISSSIQSHLPLIKKK